MSLTGSDFTNPTGGAGNPLTLPSTGNYGCSGFSGGYRFRRFKSNRYKSKRCARGTKKRTMRGKKTKKKKKMKKMKKKTRGRRGGYHYGKKHHDHSKKMRGGMHALTPGVVSENISLTTSMDANNVPSSFGFSLGGDQNTMSGALANPPPHTRYQQCPDS